MELKRQLIYLNNIEAMEKFQKSKIKWALEGDENSKFFHGVVNKRRSQLAIRAGRHILDGPFILDEVLQWCKRKKKHAMFFKVDFAKAYDLVRWDYLLDILVAFGFDPTWCKWIRDDEKKGGSRWFIFLGTFVTRFFMAIGPPIWITDDFEALVFGMSIHATFFTFEVSDETRTIGFDTMLNNGEQRL
nr:RNA-directed DNA polymerase, eukaryota [Tanacetum cinerariifolium]